MATDPTARRGYGWRFMGWDEVYNQRERDQERRDRWTELRKLAAANDSKTFFARYADYLEWDGIESPDRKALHKMARAVSAVES